MKGLNTKGSRNTTPIIVLINFCGILCQDNLEAKREKCITFPDLLNRQCCVFPPFFNRAVARKCGARSIVQAEDKVNNITSYRRHTVNTCNHWACVLQEYGLLCSAGYLDENKYFEHLDRWVDLNPMFADAILQSKVACKDAIRMYLPLKPCEFYQLHGCIREHVNVLCPVTKPTKECDDYKEFMKECKEFYTEL